MASDAITELRRLRLEVGGDFSNVREVWRHIHRRIAELEAAQAEPSDAEVEAWHKQCEALAGEGKLSLDVMGALFTANDLLRRGRGDQRLRELARDVANSGVSFDDERLKYVEVQIDRETWDELRAALGGAS